MELIKIEERRNFLKQCSFTAFGIGAFCLCSPIAKAKTLLDYSLENQEQFLPTAYFKETRLLLGTIVSIQISQETEEKAFAVTQDTFNEIMRLENIFSRHKSDSALSVLNEQGFLIFAPLELIYVLEKVKYIEQLSGSAFNVAVKPILDLLDKYKNESAKSDYYAKLPVKEWQEALSLVIPNSFRLNNKKIILVAKDVKLTLDGIAKGFIIDKASDFLRQRGITNYLINAGGDIRACGYKNKQKEPWLVVVEAINKNSAYPSYIKMGEKWAKSLATSGISEHYYDLTKEYNHLILSASGKSPQHLFSVSVLANSVLEADALATALSVMPISAGKKLISSFDSSGCFFVDKQGQEQKFAAWS